MTISLRLETAFGLLLYLAGRFGYFLNKIEEKFSMLERTIYRYFQTLKNAVFVMVLFDETDVLVSGDFRNYLREQKGKKRF